MPKSAENVLKSLKYRALSRNRD